VAIPSRGHPITGWSGGEREPEPRLGHHQPGRPPVSRPAVQAG
jgi:hypothetical protein